MDEEGTKEEEAEREGGNEEETIWKGKIFKCGQVPTKEREAIGRRRERPSVERER